MTRSEIEEQISNSINVFQCHEFVMRPKNWFNLTEILFSFFINHLSWFYHRYVATATAAAASGGKKTRTIYSRIRNAVDLKMRLDYTFRCDFIVLMKRSNVLIMKNSLLQTKWQNGIARWTPRNSITETVPTKQTVFRAKNFRRTIHYAWNFCYT